MSGETRDIEALTRPSSGADQEPELVRDMLAALAEVPDLPSAEGPTGEDQLGQAMQYSLSLRGKRARGLLVLLIVQGWGKPWRSGTDCAHAVEMVHTASLIIDDLPSMDDAGTRRGKPTNHVKFGEPTAILAGIALLSEALRLLSTSSQLQPVQRNMAVSCLASAIGPQGMSAGQIRDIHPPGSGLADIELTHALKTGSLFAAAAELGCIASGVDGPRKWMLSDFGMLLGKAFQEFDDLIDLTTAPQVAGKDTLKDIEKPTIVGLIGREDALKRAFRQIALALECLDASSIDAPELRRYVLELTRAMRGVIGNTEVAAGGEARCG